MPNKKGKGTHLGYMSPPTGGHSKMYADEVRIQYGECRVKHPGEQRLIRPCVLQYPIQLLKQSIGSDRMVTPKITREQMDRWRKLEDEHSRNPAIQERIVKQHVAAHGIGYYPALARMEARLKKK